MVRTRRCTFPQEHPPGREAQIDFTHGDSLEVTVGGQPHRHLLFQLVLSHSGWRYAEVTAGETFLALKQGLQNALWELGGVPQVARSDNTSAATHEVRRSRGRELNDVYAALLDHYGLQSTRINRGQSHENGVAEQGHYRLKDAIDQALILRGSRDFDTVGDYADFVGEMVQRRNRLVQGKLEQERIHLRPTAGSSHAGIRQLPGPGAQVEHHPGSRPHLHRPFPPHRERGAGPAVRRHGWKSTTRTTWWKAWPGSTVSGRPTSTTATSSALWSASPGPLPATGSGSNCSPPCTSVWPTMPSGSGAGSGADVEYVRILHLAATTMEATVDSALALLLEAGEPFDYAAVRDLAEPRPPEAPVLTLAGRPDLKVYDSLLTVSLAAGRVCG